MAVVNNSPPMRALTCTPLPSSVPSRSTRALRTVQKHGGLDPYLLAMDDAKLAPEGLRLKRRVRKALAGGSRAATTS